MFQRNISWVEKHAQNDYPRSSGTFRALPILDIFMHPQNASCFFFYQFNQKTSPTQTQEK